MNALEALSDQIQAFKDVTNCRIWPPGMPGEPVEAAKWWQRHIEAPKDNEGPRATQGGETRYPYIERAQYLLTRFLKLPLIDQRLVIGAAEDGIFWRGDEIETFRLIIDQHSVIQEEGAVAYRKRASRLMRGLGMELVCSKVTDEEFELNRQVQLKRLEKKLDRES